MSWLRSCVVGCLVLVGLTAGLAAGDREKSLPAYSPDAAVLRESCAFAERLPRQRAGKVTQQELIPHWLEGGHAFWYLRESPHQFILVDVATGSQNPAFDHDRLAKELKAAGVELGSAGRLPFARIRFIEENKAVSFQIKDQVWKFNLEEGTLAKAGKEDGPPEEPRPGTRGRGGRRPVTAGPRFWATGPATSADGKWSAFLKDHNLWMKSTAEGEAKQLTDSGKEGAAFTRFAWAPDSEALVAVLETTHAPQTIHIVESSPRNEHRGRHRPLPYAQPGDPMTQYQLFVIPLADQKPIKIDVEPSDFGGVPRPRWRADGRRFLYEKTDRGHQRFRLLEVDSHSGAVRAIIDETTKTFLNQLTHYTHYVGDEAVIYASERSGWNHLYWVELGSGNMRPITQGSWRVRRVEATNDGQQLLWLSVSGMDAEQDPYFVHWVKVNYDGSGFTRLTNANGTHQLRFSPDWSVAVATWSRVDQPPVHELRRTSDGTLVATLETAEISALKNSGWQPPQVFTAKGRDGTTDIWGIVFLPPQFNSEQRFPVIENIYAGPQDSFVPKGFRSFYGEMEKLAQLGFVVVQIDGMGTGNRSKAFHDVCWQNIADAGLPDRIKWLQALAKQYPQIDLERVGIYGTSAGGQSSTGALLFHPEFYKVAVSSCGCHDNRIDKLWWNEQWMGYPVGPHYAEQSNITQAAKLRGRLMLIVGEVDTNVPPESTYRLADALIKAGKEFELVVLPGAGHTDGGAYGQRKRRDFFLRNLLKVDPPEVNAQ